MGNGRFQGRFRLRASFFLDAQKESKEAFRGSFGPPLMQAGLSFGVPFWCRLFLKWWSGHEEISPAGEVHLCPHKRTQKAAQTPRFLRISFGCDLMPALQPIRRL